MITLFNITRYHMRGNDINIILNDVSAKFSTKSRIGILAQSGNGKSTLIRIISGTERPNAGTIDRSAKLSFLIGTTAGFHPGLSGAENITHLARLLHLNIYETLDYCESFADIGSYFKQPVSSYSPALKARLGFALSMSVEYDTYISDGIISAGDNIFRDKCEAALQNRLERSGLILASRHKHTLNKFCDEFYALHEGRLIKCASAEEAQDLLDYAGKYGDAYWNEVARHA